MSVFFALLKRQFLLLSAKKFIAAFICEALFFVLSVYVAGGIFYYSVATTYLYHSILSLPGMFDHNSIRQDLRSDDRKYHGWNRHLSIAPVSSYLIFFSYLVFSFIFLFVIKTLFFLSFIFAIGFMCSQFSFIIQLAMVYLFYLFTTSFYTAIFINVVSFFIFNNTRFFHFFNIGFCFVSMMFTSMVGPYAEFLNTSEISKKAKVAIKFLNLLFFLPFQALLSRQDLLLKLTMLASGSPIKIISHSVIPKTFLEKIKLDDKKRMMFEYNFFSYEKFQILKDNLFNVFSVSHEIVIFLVSIILIITVCAFIFVRDEKSYTK